LRQYLFLFLFFLGSLQAAGEVEIIQSSTVCDLKGCYEPEGGPSVETLERDDLFKEVSFDQRFTASDVDTNRLPFVDDAIEDLTCEHLMFFMARAEEREGYFIIESLQSVEPSYEGVNFVVAHLLGSDGISFPFELRGTENVSAVEGDRVFFYNRPAEHSRAGEQAQPEANLWSVNQINERCRR